MDNHMTANDFFIPWEAFAHGWISSRDNSEDIINISSSSRDLVWRGVSNASYPLHSSLYRKLLTKFGVPPTEAQMVSAETRILRAARNSWRFDNLSALEIFAQIQHLVSLLLNFIDSCQIISYHLGIAPHHPSGLVGFIFSGWSRDVESGSHH